MIGKEQLYIGTVLRSMHLKTYISASLKQNISHIFEVFYQLFNNFLHIINDCSEFCDCSIRVNICIFPKYMSIIFSLTILYVILFFIPFSNYLISSCLWIIVVSFTLFSILNFDILRTFMLLLFFFFSPWNKIKETPLTLIL